MEHTRPFSIATHPWARCVIIPFAGGGIVGGAVLMWREGTAAQLGYLSHVLLAASWGAGLGGMASSLAACGTLLFGGSLSRRFFALFTASVAWFAALAVMITIEAAYALRGELVSVAFKYGGIVGTGSIVAGLIGGSFIGRKSAGFFLRGKVKPVIHSALLGIGAVWGCCYAATEVRHLGAWPPQIVVVCGVASIMVGLAAAITTVIYIAAKPDPPAFSIQLPTRDGASDMKGRADAGQADNGQL